MQRFWQFLYSALTIPLLWIVLQTLGLFNAKVRRGIAGRKLLFEDLERQVKTLGPGKRVWFHSSSMGEFEQAKPVIAALKSRSPGVQIIVSFYSPSGYEHSRKYPHAGVITYLPFDTRAGAQRFLDLIRPDVAVMVRYDIWPNHIWELQRRGIPIMIANATMRRQTRRRIPFVRNFHHYVYNAIDNILTVSQLDVEAFGYYALHHPRIEAIGDTRYDQVRLRSAEARKHTIIPPGMLKDKRVVVIGSSWPEDEAVILPALFRLQESMENLLFIIVPHEPALEHIEDLERDLTGRATFLRFSVVNEYAGERVLIVDSIGILLILYAVAHVAYVGGSFRHGVHNVLEAAVYGIPVLFGPNHRNSQEPLVLVGQGGGFIVNDSAELERTLRNLLDDESARRTAGERAARFVESNVGATGRFLQRLEPHLTPEQPLHVRNQ
jgi:3-deoxy-D-manno-octulosonic-acid transferase